MVAPAVRRSEGSMSVAKVSSLEMPIPENAPAVSTNSKKLKALFLKGRSRFHRFIKFRVVDTDAFQFFVLGVIVANAITLAMDTIEYTHINWSTGLEIFDYICLAVYIVEFLLKVYADPIGYWVVLFNLFDFGILLLALLQIFVESFTSSRTGFQVLRVFRIVRVLRIMRTVRFVKGLEVLTVALWETVRRWLVSTLLLMILLIYFAAIIGHNVFKSEDIEHWGSLRVCFISVAAYATTDGWYDVHKPLEMAGYFNSSRFFAMISIWSISFTFTNLFVAVILMNIGEATTAYEEQEAERKAKILRHKKELMMMQQREALKQLMHFQRKGRFLNFQQMVAEFEQTLKHEDIVVLPDLCTNIVWLETYILTMENMTNTLHSVQQFHFEMANILTKALELNLHSKYGISTTNF